MARAAERDDGPRRILVGEDQPQMRSLIAARLRREGYEVLEAQDGGEVLEMIESPQSGRAPDAVVCDVRMPKRSGLEVLERVQGGDKEMPVVLITAFGDADLHERAERLGAACVLDKPFDLDDLVFAVWSLVEP